MSTLRLEIVNSEIIAFFFLLKKLSTINIGWDFKLPITEKKARCFNLLSFVHIGNRFLNFIHPPIYEELKQRNINQTTIPKHKSNSSPTRRRTTKGRSLMTSIISSSEKEEGLWQKR